MSERSQGDIGRIVETPGVMGGRPCIAGTRIPPTAVWSFHRDGCTILDIMTEYPTLHISDVLAAVAWCEGRRYQKRKRKGKR